MLPGHGNIFVDLKSNSALKSNKGHNLLKSVFMPLLVSYNGIYSRIIKCKTHLFKIGDFELHSVMVKYNDKIL